MKKHSRILKRAVCVLLAVILLCGTLGAAASAGAPLPQMYFLCSGETDENGNYLPDRILDADGREVTDETGFVYAAADSLPSAYDLRDLDCITPVKNQAAAGSCWSFSAISALESSYIRKGYGTLEDTDFSEAHLVWFSQNQRCTDPNDPTYGDGKVCANPFSSGGNWNAAAAQLMRGSGVQLESNAPWYENNDVQVMTQKMTQSESDRYVSYARMWRAESVRSLSVQSVKQKIMQFGTVAMSYYDDTDGYGNGSLDRTHFGYYQNTMIGRSNHSVSVIGWDDDFSVGNFKAECRPSADGAWLVKGSWGTRHGSNGYYWVSYEDPSITSFTAYEAAPADIYENIYQYDGAYPGILFSSSSGAAAMANVFAAKDDEILTHAAFYTPNELCDAVIDVYVANAGAAYNTTNPTTGMQHITAATTSVSDVCYGYRTVELAQPVSLRAGQYFVILVTLNSLTATKTYVPVEGKTVSAPADGVSTYSGNGRSFLKIGNTWYNTEDGDLGADYNDVPVKAMTTDRVHLRINTLPEKLRYFVGETLDTTGLSLTLDTQTITTGYTCTPTVLTTAGTQTITVTCGGKTASFDVEVKAMPQLLLSGGTAHQGETVQVTVTLQDNPGLVATLLSLDYDDDALELLSVTDGGLLGEGNMVSGGDLSAVPYNVLWMDALAQQNYVSNGILLTYTFRVRDDAPTGATALTLTYDTDSTCDMALRNVPFEVQNGSWNILSHLPGDADRNGAVDLRDAAVLRRFLADWDVTVDAFNADVNGDRVLSLQDVALICRSIVGGWDVTLV